MWGAAPPELMHPIERLRYVARASGAPQEVIVRETAGALVGLGWDPPGLVIACRRILDRHPLSGPLWWLAARVLTAADPSREAWAAVEDLAADRTAAELAFALPEEATIAVLGWPERVAGALPQRGDLEVLVIDALGEGTGLARQLLRVDVEAIDVPQSGLGMAVVRSQLLVLEATALGPAGFVGIAGSRAAATVARHAGVPMWVVAGVGRVLPAPMWQVLSARLEDVDDPWDDDDEIVPADLIDAVVGPRGLESPDEALARPDCPVAAELLRSVDRLD